ncbi:hypothetical protein V8F20_010303 [Naviculisporaceae sp. PSN 640]
MKFSSVFPIIFLPFTVAIDLPNPNANNGNTLSNETTHSSHSPLAKRETHRWFIANITLDGRKQPGPQDDFVLSGQLMVTQAFTTKQGSHRNNRWDVAISIGDNPYLPNPRAGSLRYTTNDRLWTYFPHADWKVRENTYRRAYASVTGTDHSAVIRVDPAHLSENEFGVFTNSVDDGAKTYRLYMGQITVRWDGNRYVSGDVDVKGLVWPLRESEVMGSYKGTFHGYSVSSYKWKQEWT